MLTAEGAKFLMDEVHPILKVAVPRCVRPLPGETVGDLIADAIGSAVKSIVSLENRGKPLPARSISYYSIQHLKVGRRMLDCGVADVYASPRRRANDDITSFDEVFEFLDGESHTIEDLIPDPHPDPSEEVGRRLAWDDLMGCLTCQQRKVLRDVAEGRRLVDTAKELGVSPPRITKIKREIGEKVKLVMGSDILDEVASESRWASDLRCQRERKASRIESFAEEY